MRLSKTFLTFLTAIGCILLFTQIGLILFKMDSSMSSRTKNVYLISFQNKYPSSNSAISKGFMNNVTEKKILTTLDITSYLFQNSYKSKFMLKMEKRMKERKNRLEENCKRLGR